MKESVIEISSVRNFKN